MIEEKTHLLEQRLNASLARVDSKLDSIADALQTLVRLEERQVQISQNVAHLASSVTDHDTRLRAVEITLPGLKELRTWVIGGVLSGLGMIAAAAFSYLKGHV